MLFPINHLVMVLVHTIGNNTVVKAIMAVLAKNKLSTQ